MEITNQSLFNNNTTTTPIPTKTEKQDAIVKNEKEKETSKVYDFLFKNADDKFLDAFSKATSNMSIMNAASMKTKVEVELIKFHKEGITADLKEELGDDFELTDEIKATILEEAKKRASEEGLGKINVNDFMTYMNQNATQNPLLQIGDSQSFFTTLQANYNSQSINSLG